MPLEVGLGIVAGLLALLAVPVEAHLVLERDASVTARADLAWLFGLVRVRLYPRARGERASRGPRAPEHEGAPRRRRSSGARLARRVLVRADLRARSIHLLRDLVRMLRPRDVHLRGRIGLDDPADTGFLWGLVGPLAAGLARHDVHLEPDFTGEVLWFRGSARLRVVPIRVLLLATGYLLSPPLLRALVAR